MQPVCMVRMDQVVDMPISDQTDRFRLSIGDFSRMTHLSVKALRHYHELAYSYRQRIDRNSRRPAQPGRSRSQQCRRIPQCPGNTGDGRRRDGQQRAGAGLVGRRIRVVARRSCTARIEPAGPAGALFPGEFYQLERADLVAYLPLRNPLPRPYGHVVSYTVPAAELAIAVHRGALTDIDCTSPGTVPRSPRRSFVRQQQNQQPRTEGVMT